MNSIYYYKATAENFKTVGTIHPSYPKIVSINKQQINKDHPDILRSKFGVILRIIVFQMDQVYEFLGKNDFTCPSD